MSLEQSPDFEDRSVFTLCTGRGARLELDLQVCCFFLPIPAIRFTVGLGVSTGTKNCSVHAARIVSRANVKMSAVSRRLPPQCLPSRLPVVVSLVVRDSPPRYCFTFALFYIWEKRCLLYTSPSPRDKRQSRMPSSA